MEYNFNEIEKKWRKIWTETKAYKVENDFTKPKCYVLDMFPYPSGSGLHVGHPLGYIASDIYARYKRLKGFNVLHPMGYDAFGLPAEQYAIEHGVHPAKSTADNMVNFRNQLDNISFSYDWDRQVNTSEPQYYKWTQWIFLQLFNSFYNKEKNKAEDIDVLIKEFEINGNIQYPISNIKFTSEDWKTFNENEKLSILMQYRLAFCGYGEVNWCEALGTVLANDEVVNGVSERGGHPVEKKKLRQWYLRITDYAERLLEGLQTVDFSDSMKEMQSNWIGRSQGAEISFQIQAPSRPSPEGKEPDDTLDAINNKQLNRETARKSTYVLLKELSKKHKDNPTPEESLLWQRLRDHGVGFHIRRQHIIDMYIVDFVCLEKQVTIEIDGDYHNSEEQKDLDKARTEFLNELGYEEIRFTNAEVNSNIDSVVEKIKQKLNSKPTAGKVLPSGEDLGGASLTVYTTRPDTIFGVDFMVIAPELDLVHEITTTEQKTEVENYLTYVKSRSERERMAEKKITGCFTGAYAINPFNKKQIPIWISEYVLAGYGTGAIMAVPCGDERDYKFAKHFNISITNIIGDAFNGEDANPTKDAPYTNSDFVNGMTYKAASDAVITKLEAMGMGKRKINYKMRDAAFSRQRYWGEPFPIVWDGETAYDLPESILPLELPHLDEIKPGENGQGPLANHPTWTKDWQKYFAKSSSKNPPLEGREAVLETSTMPGYAGSSWYFLRYMDPHNNETFCDKKISDYWNQVDVYVGGTEHAVGHLLYSRMWTKFLYDKGYIGFDEPFKKLLNQGMITGSSRFVYRVSNVLEYNTITKEETNFGTIKQVFVSKNLVDKITELFMHKLESEKNNVTKYAIEERLKAKEIIFKHLNLNEEGGKYVFGIDFNNLHADVNIVDGFELNMEAFKKWRNGEYANAEFILEEDGKYICGAEVEKMSKSKFNTVNPDELVTKYGADTFRMYEMFLGPVEMSKPWDTKGIEGVNRFIKKLWRLYFDEIKGNIITMDTATDAELKVLHRTIKKIEEDTEKFSYNTAVSAFMICVNELTDLKCHKREILLPLCILLAPYAPHIAEELFQQMHKPGDSSVLDASFPAFEPKYLQETSKEYPISINGKMRTTMSFATDMPQQEIEKHVLENEIVQKWLEGKAPKKIIYVKNRMVNVVI